MVAVIAPWSLSEFLLYQQARFYLVLLSACCPPNAHRAEDSGVIRFIGHFVPMFDEKVPQISILREFIGGSHFHY